MHIIGLCGGSGSGKTYVSEIFLSYNIPSIDADSVYAELTLPGAPLISELAEIFGNKIIADNGGLNRKELSNIVFAEGAEDIRKTLNSITHRAVLMQTDKIIKEYDKNGKKYIIFDAPLLFESGFDKKCDTVIAVIADENIRIKRITERDGISENDAKKRIASQISDVFLKEHADFVIINNGTYEELKSQVFDIAEKILKR